MWCSTAQDDVCMNAIVRSSNPARLRITRLLKFSFLLSAVQLPPYVQIIFFLNCVLHQPQSTFHLKYHQQSSPPNETT
jgi:hypothetical protein